MFFGTIATERLRDFCPKDTDWFFIVEPMKNRFEDSTQPAKRIKQEPTDPDVKESKVFVDAITQTEAFDADLKVEITTQTDRPLIFVCKLYMCGHNRF